LTTCCLSVSPCLVWILLKMVFVLTMRFPRTSTATTFFTG